MILVVFPTLMILWFCETWEKSRQRYTDFPVSDLEIYIFQGSYKKRSSFFGAGFCTDVVPKPLCVLILVSGPQFRINVTWKKILWLVRQFLLALHNIKSSVLFTFKTCKFKEWTNGEGPFVFAKFLIYTDFLIYFLKTVSVRFWQGFGFQQCKFFLIITDVSNIPIFKNIFCMRLKSM